MRNEAVVAILAQEDRCLHWRVSIPPSRPERSPWLQQVLVQDGHKGQKQQLLFRWFPRKESMGGSWSASEVLVVHVVPRLVVGIFFNVLPPAVITPLVTDHQWSSSQASERVANQSLGIRQSSLREDEYSPQRTLCGPRSPEWGSCRWSPGNCACRKSTVLLAYRNNSIR